jgi:hypothetical protein
MTPEDRAAIASLERTVRAMAETLGARIDSVESKIRHHSGFITAANGRASKAGDGLNDLSGAVMSQFGVVERSIADVRAAQSELAEQVAAVKVQISRDTQGQNIELAVQTSTLNQQTTTLEKFRRTPLLTTAAGVVGTGAGAALWEFASHWLKATGH